MVSIDKDDTKISLLTNQDPRTGSGSTLLPMLVGGLVLIVVGMLAIVLLN
jgi:hypothetical protein